MKKCLSPNDVLELSETQKSTLRNLWQPNKYDLAVEIVWKDVENDRYDGIVLLVTDIRVRVVHTNYCHVELKALYLDNPPQYDGLEMEAESEESTGDDSFEDSTETDTVDIDADLGDDNQDQYSDGTFLSKETCLPLFSIGQMIEIVTKNKSELNISFTPDEAVCYIEGKEFLGDELCDALWEAVKTLL